MVKPSRALPSIPFSTGPLDPSFSLDVPQSVALYNAYGDTIVPVQTVNISELDFELYGLSVADLLNLTGSKQLPNLVAIYR